MSETARFTRDQVDAMELAPGTRRENLEGWVPETAGEEELRQALDKALDYRGDVTLTLKDGQRVEAFIFDRRTGPSLAGSLVRYYSPGAPEKRSLSFDRIARLEFSGRDCAAGRQWKDWVKRREERLAAGEKHVALMPEPLD